MTSTLLTGTLFGLLDWCLQIRKSVALIQITKNFSNKYISIFYAPWQTSMFSIQISSQVHQKIALGGVWDRDRGPSVSFERPIKLDRGPAETMLKPAAAQSKELLGVGRGLRSGQGAIRQFWKAHKTRQGASRNHAKARRSWIQGALGRGEGFEIGAGGHPSVLKSHKKTRQRASRNAI